MSEVWDELIELCKTKDRVEIRFGTEVEAHNRYHMLFTDHCDYQETILALHAELEQVREELGHRKRENQRLKDILGD